MRMIGDHEVGVNSFGDSTSSSSANIIMKFYEEIECDHGWTDGTGFARCDLGTSCSIDFICYCSKEVCPIYEEENDEENKE